MKFRTDFVTNSSSSNFATIRIKSPMIKERLKEISRDYGVKHCQQFYDKDGYDVVIKADTGFLIDFEPSVDRILQLLFEYFEEDSLYKDGKSDGILKEFTENRQKYLDSVKKLNYYYGGYSWGDEGHNHWHDSFNYIAPISNKMKSTSDTGPRQDPLKTSQKDSVKQTPVQLSVDDCIIHDGILAGYRGKEKAIVLPEGINKINDKAFYRCHTLRSIVIPEGVHTIGEQAFSECYSLESVKLPHSLRKIGYMAFDDCDSLTDLYIDSSVNSIGTGAFPDWVTIHVPVGSNVERYCYNEHIHVRCDYPGNEEEPSEDNKPALTQSLSNYVCCLTGDFNFGSKEDVERYIVARGGVCKSSLTRAVNMLIIGGLGSDRYSFGSYGKKYIQAKERQDKGEDMTILTEKEFFGKTRESDEKIKDSDRTRGDDDKAEDSDRDTFEISDGILIKYTGIAQTVLIPNDVKEIGRRVFFGQNNVKSVVIPDSVTEIDDHAFFDCESLESIPIPDSIVKIGHQAFCGCKSLAEFNIPSSVNEIHEGTFVRCTSLKNITIPDGMRQIGNSAFNSCSSLTSITIPKSVTKIEDNAFSYCTSLTSITIPDSITGISRGTFNGCTSLTNVTIPNSVTTIGDFAFSGCKNLTNVTIPNSVIDIGAKAFYGCSSLMSLTIPDSVTYLGEGALQNCASLTDIHLSNKLECIHPDMFKGCKSLKSITIPDSIISIGDRAFSDCANLANITASDTVIKLIIDNKALVGMGNPGVFMFLKDPNDRKNAAIKRLEGDVQAGETETAICDYIRKTKKKLLIEIARLGKVEAFSELINILGKKKIALEDIDAAINEANGKAEMSAVLMEYKNKTYSNQQVERAIIIAKEKELGIRNFTLSDWKKIFVLADTKEGYKINKYKGNDKAVYIPSTINNKRVVEIGDKAFRGNLTVTDVTIPVCMIRIGKEAFKGCSSLKTVAVSTDATYSGEVSPNDYTGFIEDQAFEECTNLKSVVIPEGVTRIGDEAFYRCESLENVSIPDGVIYIGNMTFAACWRIESITIPKSVTELGGGAFSYCKNLRTVTLLAIVTKIGEFPPFFGCDTVTIYFPDWACVRYIGGRNLRFEKTT